MNNINNNCIESSRKGVVETSGLCVNPLSIDETILEKLLQANTALIELEQDFISTAKTFFFFFFFF